MGKAAARKSSTTKDDSGRDYLAMFDARTQIVTASLNMGWQLAITVLIPLFIGVKLDQRFDTSPSWTLVALFVAVTGSAVLISRTFKDMTATQSLKPAKSISKAKSKKVSDA